MPIINLSPVTPTDGARAAASPAPDKAGLAELIGTWRVGQVLQARAISASDGTGRLLLQLGRLEIPAWSNVPIARDQGLRLEVVQHMTRVPLLKIVNQLSVESKRDVAPFLRLALPRQSEPARLLQNLQDMLRTPPAPLPRPLKESAEALLRSLQTLEQLRQPQGLAQAIRDSGQFMESRLGEDHATAHTLATDFKARLLRLAGEIRHLLATASEPPELMRSIQDTGRGQAHARVVLLASLFREGRLPLPQLARLLLRQLPAEDLIRLGEALEAYAADRRLPRSLPAEAMIVIQALRQRGRPRASAASLLQGMRLLPLLDSLQPQVEAVLARIQSNQLLSAGREGAGVFLMLDLPLRQGDTPATVGLQLEDASADGRSADQDREWRVTLNFDLAGLGPLEVKVGLRGERLDTRFQARRAASVQRLNAALPRLNEALHGLGLRLERSEVTLDRNDPLRPPMLPGPATILDEMA